MMKLNVFWKSRFTTLNSVFSIYDQDTFANDLLRSFLVELALARLDSKNAGVSFFSLCVGTSYINNLESKRSYKG